MVAMGKRAIFAVGPRFLWLHGTLRTMDPSVDDILKVFRSKPELERSYRRASTIVPSIDSLCGSDLALKARHFSSPASREGCYCCKNVRNRGSCVFASHPLWLEDEFCPTCQKKSRCVVCERRLGLQEIYLDAKTKTGRFSKHQVGGLPNRNPLWICAECHAAGIADMSASTQQVIQTVVEFLRNDPRLHMHFASNATFPLKPWASTADNSVLSSRSSPTVPIYLVDMHVLSRPVFNGPKPNRTSPGNFQYQLVLSPSLNGTDWNEELVFGRCECVSYGGPQYRQHSVPGRVPTDVPKRLEKPQRSKTCPQSTFTTSLVVTPNDSAPFCARLRQWILNWVPTPSPTSSLTAFQPKPPSSRLPSCPSIRSAPSRPSRQNKLHPASAVAPKTVSSAAPKEANKSGNSPAQQPPRTRRTSHRAHTDCFERFSHHFRAACPQLRHSKTYPLAAERDQLHRVTKILVARDLPVDTFASTLAHELTHAYIFANGYKFNATHEEGICNAVCMYYMYVRAKFYIRAIERLDAAYAAHKHCSKLGCVCLVSGPGEVGRELLREAFPSEYDHLAQEVEGARSTSAAPSTQQLYFFSNQHDLNEGNEPGIIKRRRLCCSIILRLIRERLILKQRLCVYRFKRMMFGDTKEYLAAVYIFLAFFHHGLPYVFRSLATS